MPRFMEYKESTYRLLSAVVILLGLLVLSSIVYWFVSVLTDASPRTDGVTVTGKWLQVVSVVVFGGLYLFFLYWRRKVRIVRASIKGLYAAAEQLLDEDGDGSLLNREMIGEDGLRFNVEQIMDTGMRIDGLRITKWIGSTEVYSCIVWNDRIVEPKRDYLPPTLMPGFNRLALAMKGWVALSKSRNFGPTSDHASLSTDVDNGEAILPVSA